MPGKTPIATRDARALLLVQAVEETDRQGRLLPAYERGRATDLARAELDRRGEGAAGASAGGTEAARAADAAIVVRRARLLLEVLRGRLAAVERVTAEIPFAPIALGTIAIALLLGLTSSALGPGRRVNILAVPILGMILWNLAVYLLLILGLLFRRRGPRASGKKDGGGSRPDSETAAPAGTPADGRERGLPARLAHWLLALASRPFRPRGAGDVRLTAEALGRFAALWRGYALPLTVARIRVLLHAGAMALIGGAIAGMYARGLIFEYRATWESTFLEAEQLARLLGAVLAPAAALLGESIPPIAGLEAPASGAAAPWIHLWAATALIFVGAPRALLALTGAWRARRVAARLSIDLDQGIYRRILAAGRGRECRVEVIPYSYHLGPRRADTLRAQLHDLFGTRAEIALGEPVDYGEEYAPAGAADAPATAGAAARGQRCRVVLFSLAQSPEIEVHGEFVVEARRALAAQERLLVLIDGSPLRERVEGSGIDPSRLDERRRTWDRTLRDARVTGAHLDLGRPPAENGLTAMAEALWPPEEALEVR